MGTGKEVRIKFGRPSGKTRIAAGMLAAVAGMVAAVAVVTPAHAASAVDCNYTFDNWTGGNTVELYITNNGPAIDGWTAYWELPSPAVLGVVWDANITQISPTEMTATNLSYNAEIPTGGVVAFGWNATWSTPPGAPIELTLNGVDC
jgi:endoglucanase